MRHNNEEQMYFAIIVILAIIAALGVWKFSQLLGLDMGTGFRIMAGIIILCIVFGLVWTQFELGIGATLPLALAGLWMVFWPALDVWATPHVPSFMLDRAEPQWFASWYVKAGGLVAILGVGYAPWYFRDR